MKREHGKIAGLNQSRSMASSFLLGLPALSLSSFFFSSFLPFLSSELEVALVAEDSPPVACFSSISATDCTSEGYKNKLQNSC